MPAVSGTTVLLKRGDGESSETFTTIGQLSEKDISFDGETVDTTTDENVDGSGQVWTERASFVREIMVNGTAVAKQQSPWQDLYADWAAGTVRNFQIVVPYIGTWTCAFIVRTISVAGPTKGHMPVTLALESAGVDWEEVRDEVPRFP